MEEGFNVNVHIQDMELFKEITAFLKETINMLPLESRIKRKNQLLDIINKYMEDDTKY